MAKIGRPKAALMVTEGERTELVRLTKRAHVNRLLAFRARLVLACADAPTDTVVARRCRTTNTTVGKWRKRFIERFGETFNQQIAPGEIFRVTRAVVPCDYEIAGQMLGRSLTVVFSRTSPFTTADLSRGVEKGSVVIDEGPNGVFGPSDTNCSVRFNATGGPSAPPPPFNITIRFRVSTSNVIDRGGGCG